MFSYEEVWKIFFIVSDLSRIDDSAVVNYYAQCWLRCKIIVVVRMEEFNLERDVSSGDKDASADALIWDGRFVRRAAAGRPRCIVLQSRAASGL